MKVFIRGLLAFSLAVNLAGASMVTHHRLSASKETCAAGCPWEAATGDLEELDQSTAENLEAMRRSFDTFHQGCNCEMQLLRGDLVKELVSEELDSERIESVLRSMSDRQVDLQRRLVRQLIAERSALSPQARDVFDERLKSRLLSGSSCCPGCVTH